MQWFWRSTGVRALTGSGQVFQKSPSVGIMDDGEVTGIDVGEEFYFERGLNYGI